MIRQRFLLRLALFAALLVLPPAFVSAQFGINASDFAGYQPELVLDPQTPSPKQEVKVSIGNFLSGLQGSEIVWRHNGTVLERFSNQPSAMFTASAAGQTDNISASLQTPSGQKIDLQEGFSAQYLDIIIEPQTHVPSFFSGRPLPTTGSQINVTALLNGVPKTNYIYAWRINGELLGGSSVRGQYRTNFIMPMDSRVVLTLDVMSLDGTLFTKKSVLIPNTRPFVKFYEVNTLYGLSDQNFDSLILTGNSATLRAIPFYLDSRVYNNPDILDWFLDNNQVNTNGNPYEITLERKLQSGTSNLSFRVQSTSALLQGTQGSIKVVY